MGHPRPPQPTPPNNKTPNENTHTQRKGMEYRTPRKQKTDSVRVYVRTYVRTCGRKRAAVATEQSRGPSTGADRERKRQRDREKEGVRECVCVCERDRERERVLRGREYCWLSQWPVRID